MSAGSRYCAEISPDIAHSPIPQFAKVLLLLLRRRPIVGVFLHLGHRLAGGQMRLLLARVDPERVVLVLVLLLPLPAQDIGPGLLQGGRHLTYTMHLMKINK